MGVDIQRLLNIIFRQSESFVGRLVAIDSLSSVTIGQGSQGRSNLGIQHNSLPEIVGSSLQIAGSPLVGKVKALEEEVVSLAVFSSGFRESTARFCPKLHLQFAGYGIGDLLLHGKDVFHSAIIVFGPDIPS